MNLLYESKLSLKLFWHKTVWNMTRDLPFALCKDVTIRSQNKWLHPNDMKFIVKPIQAIHQPTLETLYKKINRSMVHHSPLGKEQY